MRNRILEEIQEDIRTLTRVPSEFIHAKLVELADEVGELVNRKWIPCSERLPGESNYYMTCIYNEEVDEYDFRKTWFAHEDDYYGDELEWRELYDFEKVVAWMPLPEPYKGE